MASLALLQNRMKRDADAYLDDFRRQLAHFEAMRTLLLEQSTPQSSKETAKDFGKLAAFLAAVSPCYPKHGGERVPELIIELLDQHASEILPDLRLKLLQALILLRVKGLLGPERLIEVCFSLFKVRDKTFRATLYSYIIKDVRVVNKVKTNNELNKRIQNIVFRMLSDDERTAGTPAAAKRALSVVIELYKRRVWIDSRSVNVVANACFSRIPRNAVAAARFFLGIDDEIDELLHREDDDEDDGNPMNIGTKKDERIKQLRSSLMAPKVSKVTKKKKRVRAKHKATLRKLQDDKGLDIVDAKNSEQKRLIAPRFPAIDLIHDPQNFAERLLKMIRSSSDRFEVRLIQLNLVSRVVGHHKLLLFPFYSFCQRYLQPHHESVNNVLACVIQASHDLVPPEEVESTVKLLANNFINDRTGSEVMAVGLNAIRELIARIPLLTEGDGMKDLISDLIQYRKYRRDRSVIIAARSLLLEVRRINPRILASKERGKFHNMNNRPLEYGAQKVSEGVDGVDLLEEWLAQHGENLYDEDQDLGDDDDDDEGGSDESDDEDEDEDQESDDGEEDEENEDDDDEEEEDDDEDGEEHEVIEDDDDDRNLRGDSRSVISTGSKSTSATHLRLDARRILTDEDFKRIRALMKLEAEGKIKRHAPKSTADSAVEDNKKTGKQNGPKRIKINGVTYQFESMEDDEKETEDAPVPDTRSQTTFDVDSLGTSDEEDEDEEQNVYDPAIVDPKSLDGYRKKNRRELAEKLQQIQAENDAKKAQRRSRTVNNTEKAKRTKDFNMVAKSRQVRQKQKLSLQEQQKGISKHIKALKNKTKLLTKMRRNG